MLDHNSQPGSLEVNLVLEAAEILELHKLRGVFTEEEYRERLGSELADAYWYIITIAHLHEINLTQALLDKIEVNESRFPAQQFQGDKDDFTRQYWEQKRQNGERK